MWHTKIHFSAKCNSGRSAIQWFHIKHYLDYLYTKFQPYTFWVQKNVSFCKMRDFGSPTIPHGKVTKHNKHHIQESQEVSHFPRTYSNAIKNIQYNVICDHVCHHTLLCCRRIGKQSDVLKNIYIRRNSILIMIKQKMDF